MSSGQVPDGSASVDPDADPVGRLRGDPRWRTAWFVASAAFLLYPAFHLLSAPAAPLEAVLAIVAMVAFGTVLWRALLIDDGRIGDDSWLGIVLVVVLIGVTAALTMGWPDDGWSSVGYFAAVSAGGLMPERRALGMLGVCGVVMTGVLTVTGASAFDALLTGIAVTVIGFTVFALSGQRRMNRALYEARAELARLAVADERQRIARDLHDTLGHSLSLITLKSELAGRLLPDDPVAAKREIGDVEIAAREALAEVRQTVRGVRRTTLDGELAGVLGALRAAGIEPTVERDPQPLAPATDVLLAWAVREGVTNVMRHSHARRCTIRIGVLAGDAFAEVLDDGVGAPAIGARTADAADGTGLRGLAERIREQGGALVAGALPEQGYRLRVTLPITDGTGV